MGHNSDNWFKAGWGNWKWAKDANTPHHPGCSWNKAWFGVIPPPCNCGVVVYPPSHTVINKEGDLDKKKQETEGQYKVGASFNPSSMNVVDDIKQAVAVLIDTVSRISTNSKKLQEQAEIGRLKTLAKTKFEEGCMWAVKAATKPDRKGGWD